MPVTWSCLSTSTDWHAVSHTFWLAVLPVWIQIHFQSQSSAEGEFTHVFTLCFLSVTQNILTALCFLPVVYFLLILVKADTFFEFSDRLESIMAKAYIWRYVTMKGIQRLWFNAFFVVNVHTSRSQWFIKGWRRDCWEILSWEIMTLCVAVESYSFFIVVFLVFWGFYFSGSISSTRTVMPWLH